MPNTVIQLKKSATPSATPSSLANGELAINFADGKLFYKAANGNIVEYRSADGLNFGTVNANGTLVVSDTNNDVFTLEPGENIAIVGDAVNDKITIGLKNDVVIPSSGTFKVAAVGGSEGGEIKLGNAITNSVLTGDIIIDIYQNNLRFFESAGTNRGAFINLAAASAGVGSDLLAGASAIDAFARNTANAAFNQANTARSHANASFDKANAALPNTSGVTFAGNLTVSQILSADKIISTNNSYGENFRVGDDAWIGDFNVANAIRIKGIQSSLDGYINFGDADGALLGRTGTGSLTWANNTIWHQGNDGAGSALDADLLDGQHGSYYGIATDVVASFGQANTARNHANAAHLTANAGFNQANTARDHANTAHLTANAAFNRANTANQTADLAFGRANTANQTADLAFGQANTARTHANTAHLTANAAFDQANTARTHANNAYNIANLAFDKANTSASIANTKLSLSGGTITGDLSIVGNLSVSGNTTFISAENLRVSDPLIYLAGNNYVSDIVDIGFIANYVNATGSNVHTGLYREHEDKMYYLFNGYDQEPANNHLGALSNNMVLAVLNADIKTSNLLLGGINAISWIRSSYDQANTARDHANAAHSTANAGFNQANTARDHANTAHLTANAAYNQSNTARNHANTAHLTANAAYDQANTARDHANTAHLTANAAFDKANTANLTADLAFDQANTSRDHANSAHLTANAAFDKANSALQNTTGTFVGTLTITDDLIVRGNATIGDESTDTITINGNSISLGNNQSINSGTMFIDATNNRVGIGTTNVQYKLEVAGSFAAQTKSFIINHPTKVGMKLRYGSLEGPENGVYIRGRIKSDIIELPEYWTKLIDEDSITINLTPIGKSKMPSIDRIENNKVYLKKQKLSFIDSYYIIFAERKDVDKLTVEI